jgi:hypothetical protein
VADRRVATPAGRGQHRVPRRQHPAQRRPVRQRRRQVPRGAQELEPPRDPLQPRARAAQPRPADRGVRAPLEKDKFEHAKEYLLLVEKQLADIEVSCDKIGAKVSVDGKEVFIAPGKYSQKVRVGKHTFYADKEGYNARITAPYVGPGEKFRIELKLFTAEELTRYKRKWQNTWFPWAITGAGVVVGLAAGGLELSAQSSYDQFNTKVAACNTTSAGCANSTPGITKLRDSGDSKRMLGYVGYGVAGVAVATGLTLLWVNRSTPYQISAEELNATPQPPPLAVAPIVSPEVVGAAVQGHF